MVLFVFKIIFLVVFIIGAGIMFCAPFFYRDNKGKQSNGQVTSRKITKLRLIGLIIGAVGLLVVLILGYFE